MNKSLVHIPELSRKLIHLGNLIIPLSYLYWIPNRNQMLPILGIFTFIFLAVDLGRTRVSWINKVFKRFFNFMMRSHELKGQLTGATWVMISACFVIYFFPREIAILCLIFMSVGDTTASLVGKTIGKTKVGNKTVEGFFGGLAICLVIAWYFPVVPRLVGISGALAAMIIEILPVPVDDNLSIPLGSAFIMLIVSGLSG